MKHELHASRETLQQLWEDGLSGRLLLDKYTEAIDVFLQDRFAELTGGDGELTLVALGGYGRGELFPFSDIDLMLLHSRWVKKNILKKTAEGILYPLWDAGLEVGHSVRSVSQCLADCRNDFHLQVSMLDARQIAGSEKLFADLTCSYRKKFIEGQRREFLAKMANSREIRKRQYGGHGFQLEPNIKDGRGGFRDIQSMLWSAHGVFGLKGLSSIEGAGIFSPEERTALEQSFDSLVMIRNRLHYLSGRKNDQLFFEHQEGIASALAYKDSGGVLGVEIFMQEVYGHLDTIAVATDLFFEHIDETICSVKNSKNDGDLGNGLEVVNGRIHLADSALLVSKPITIFKVFSLAARTGLPIHFRTRKLISASLALIDDDFRSSRRVAKEFWDILGAARLLPLLTTLLETGVLSVYLPEIAPLESLAQHDVFHVNTVDRHLLQTVHELKYLAEEQAQLFSEVAKPSILYLAGLLHDVGKGRGGNHEEVGAELAGQVGKRLGLSATELSDLQFLVRQHLFLSHIAQRRDLEDEEVIFHCAELIKETNRLRMLYLLSIADARATGPNAWSDWKAALLQNLYLLVAHALDQAEWADPDRNQAIEWMRDHVVEVLAGEGVSEDLIKNLSDDYLLNYSVQEVAEHIVLKEKLGGRPAMLIPTDHDDHWSVLIISRDRTGLLSRICGTLALNNLAVLSAKIHTWQDGTVVDVIDVNPVFNNNFKDQDWQSLRNDLDLVLENRLGLTHRLASKKTARPSGPAPGHQRYSTTVRVDNRSSSFFTIIEVFAEDQPSLLYDITRTMADFEINIAKAMISTRRGQLIDVFYVLDRNGSKLTDPRNLEELRQALFFAAENSGF